ncbi:hypothetical protein AJ79_10344 [Helicocarpus griseus UAMH5409]|uniref:Uncharacterized protein n=1 Tax=Helicocarpus griseus UAMH5409 TaxID=1447875 RepID=A0A2B7WED0_9EURO|nr:hypothetical protein AJ79_10344 [Helicocarpus griseus UAMH5409]
MNSASVSSNSGRSVPWFVRHFRVFDKTGDVKRLDYKSFNIGEYAIYTTEPGAVYILLYEGKSGGGMLSAELESRQGSPGNHVVIILSSTFVTGYFLV